MLMLVQESIECEAFVDRVLSSTRKVPVNGWQVKKRTYLSQGHSFTFPRRDICFLHSWLIGDGDGLIVGDVFQFTASCHVTVVQILLQIQNIKMSDRRGTWCLTVRPDHDRITPFRFSQLPREVALGGKEGRPSSRILTRILFCFPESTMCK